MDKMDSRNFCPCHLVWIYKQLYSVVQLSEIKIAVGAIKMIA
jgi:hypothetical protein